MSTTQTNGATTTDEYIIDESSSDDSDKKKLKIDTGEEKASSTGANESNDSESLNTSTDGKKSRRRVDLGLDGGYWSRMDVSDDQSSRKRTRHSVERLAVIMNLNTSTSSRAHHHHNHSANTSLSDDFVVHDENSKTDSIASNSKTSDAKKDRCVLFKASTFITVLNDENSFFLCQCVNSIYEDSKRCKIQWLESVADHKNRYKYGAIDFIEPFSIICKVKVNKVAGHSSHLEIDAVDLKKVNNLLDKALKEGGITVDFEEEAKKEDDNDKGDAKYDKELFDGEISDEEGSKKSKKKKKSRKSLDESLSEEEDALSKKIKKKKLENNSPTESRAKSTKSKVTDGNETDDLDGEEKPKKSVKIKSEKKSPKEEKKKKEENKEEPGSQVPNLTKRQMFKVLSNRLLEENTKIEILSKDPFFEDDQKGTPDPFISPYVQSKLAFRAIYLVDMNLLKQLINDVNRVPSMHIGRAAFNNMIPAQYAIFMANKQALELLIDDFIKEESKKRIEMPDSMLNKFNNGVHNRAALNVPFIRKLTESRGVKEGNSAFTKDQDTLQFIQDHRSDGEEFFKRLIISSFEFNATTDIFDFIVSKWKIYNESSSYDDYTIYNVIGDKFNILILNGHRKLASHVLQNAPEDHGYNSIHLEVLKAENDEELKCQLRANMCTKKHYLNDFVTPIHFACINPNVKYLKTLLGITQDYNISDKKSRKPIHYAAVCEGQLPLEYLMSRVSPYEMDYLGNTPLHFACQAGRSNNVELLLNFAQNKQEDENVQTTEIQMDNKFGLGGINKPNRKGRLPLHQAIYKNHYDCVKILLKYGCNFEYPLPSSMGKITPLMFACQLGHFKIVQLLVEHRAKIEARDRFKRTAAMHASMCGNARVLSFLLRKGANPNAYDSSGNTSLHFACAYGWYHCMRLLIDAGASVNCLNEWRLTPFGCAFLKAHTGICDKLLELEPSKIDINFRTEDGKTLVMLCVSSSNMLNETSIEQLDYIVNKLNGNCLLVDSNGNNAFHYLALNNITKQAIIQQLNQENYSKKKPLTADEISKKADFMLKEQERYRKKMAEILIKAKCNPNAENNDFETALFCAFSSQNMKFARFLIKNRETTKCIITTHQNANNQTLLTLMAKYCSLFDMASIILGDKAADDQELIKLYQSEFEKMAKIQDADGLTPFQIVCIELKKYLQNTSFNICESNNKDGLPKSIVRMLNFLYFDCKSNPNEIIAVAKHKNGNFIKYVGYTDEKTDENSVNKNKKSDKMLVDEDEEEEYEDSEEEDEDDDEQDNENINKSESFSSMFLLINDHCANIVDNFIKKAKNESDLIKIDLNLNDSDGRTILIKSLIEKQSKFALKLLKANVLSNSAIVNQICKNEEKDLSENLLQLAIRNLLVDVVMEILKILSHSKLKSSDMADFLELLQHQNSYGQNFLHLLASMDSNQRAHFNLDVLNSMKELIVPYFNESHSSKNILYRFLSTKDILGRTPIHLCLLKRTSTTSDINIEQFFMENLAFDKSNDSDSKAKNLFYEADIFGRLPLHYLFFSHMFEESMFNKQNIYQIENMEKLLKKKNYKELYLGDKMSAIDPVELLTLIMNQMDDKKLDESDIFGFTSLHYAAARGSTISCTILMSHGCSVNTRSKVEPNSNDSFQTSTRGNIPLSSAIYYGHETCVLTLLRSMENSLRANGAGDSNQSSNLLKDSYYLNRRKFAYPDGSLKQTTDELEEETNKSANYERTLKYHIEEPASNEKNLVKKLPLYNTILQHKWEGISWLILDNLDKYGLNFLDAISAAIVSKELNMALRLIAKFKAKEPNTSNLLKIITQPSAERGRTLLHVMAYMKFSETEKPLIKKVLETLFKVDPNDKNFNSLQNQVYEFFKRKDEFNSTALHYACVSHNFLIIDFVLDYFKNTNNSLNDNPDNLFTRCEDASQQTPYSLLFWQIGRIIYTDQVKDTIRDYTKKYFKNDTSTHLANVKAYYPVKSYNDFRTKLINNNLAFDYPRDRDLILNHKNHQLISPLLYAIHQQDLIMIKFLIKNIGLDVNTCDSAKVNALSYAIRTNNLDICHILFNPDHAIETTAVNAPAYNYSKAYGRGRGPTKRNFRMQNLFSTILPAIQADTKKKVKRDPEDILTDEEDEGEENDDSLNEEELEGEEDAEEAEPIHRKLLSPSKVKISSNIVLNHIDHNSRTVFHHLANSLNYGSLDNIEIYKLLAIAYKKEYEAKKNGTSKMIPLSDFLKRIDYQVKKASDLALLNGNIELAELIEKEINNGSVLDTKKLSRFEVTDPTNYSASDKPNYKADSEAFLKNFNESLVNKTSNSKSDDQSCFVVDKFSRMNNTGMIIWDPKHKIPYDVILTKTDINYGIFGMHNFYKMQLITMKYNNVDNDENKMQVDNNKDASKKNDKFDENQMCVLFTRWGRVGLEGQYQRTPFANFREARAEFLKIFKQKTANDFVDTVLEKKKPFEKKPKRYNLIQLELRRKPKLKDIKFEIFDAQNTPQKLFDQSKLKKINAYNSIDYKEFWSDLLNVSYLKSQVLQITHLSVEFLPLTQLNGETIDKAYELLDKKLRPLIDKRMELEKRNKKEVLVEYTEVLDQINHYSNTYYEMIPQLNYNFEKLEPISSENELNKQYSIMNQLNKAHVAIRMLMGAKYAMSLNSSINPFDYIYNAINAKFELMCEKEAETQYILRYICPMNDPTKNDFQVKRIFKFQRDGEQERFDSVKLASGASKLKNRILLWHGTSVENLISIMNKGLLKSPTDSKFNGARFGKGIYFSDSFKFSTNYCNGNRKTITNLDDTKSTVTSKFMLLCEVALGKIKDIKNELLDKFPPKGYDSVLALGNMEPNPNFNVFMPNGAKIPLGERSRVVLKPGELYYRQLQDSQYVVYDESQVCIRYIVQFYE